MPPTELATLAPSMPARQLRAVLARLQEDEILGAYFGNRIRVVQSEDAADAQGEASPELLLWLAATEEERLPSRIAKLTSRLMLRFSLPPEPSGESDPSWRSDLISHAKGVIVTGDLSDEDGIVADYLESWDRVDAFRRTAGNGSLRSAVGFALICDIQEVTREYSE